MESEILYNCYYCHRRFTSEKGRNQHIVGAHGDKLIPDSNNQKPTPIKETPIIATAPVIQPVAPVIQQVKKPTPEIDDFEKMFPFMERMGKLNMMQAYVSNMTKETGSNQMQKIMFERLEEKLSNQIEALRDEIPDPDDYVSDSADGADDPLTNALVSKLLNDPAQTNMNQFNPPQQAPPPAQNNAMISNQQLQQLKMIKVLPDDQKKKLIKAQVPALDDKDITDLIRILKKL